MSAADMVALQDELEHDRRRWWKKHGRRIMSRRPKITHMNVIRIQKRVADFFQLTRFQLLEQRRTKDVAFARQFAMYHSRRLPGQSYPALARAFERDHTTVMNGCKRIAEAYKMRPADMLELEKAVFG